jgi:hypothetical protein
MKKCFLSCRGAEDLVRWCEVRDELLAMGKRRTSSVKKVFELVTACNHPDAVWMTELFAGRDVNTSKEVIQVFLQCDNDARALCFAGLLEGDVELLTKAAEMGYAFAQAKVARINAFRSMFEFQKAGTTEVEGWSEAKVLEWAECAASKNEPFAFLLLGEYYNGQFSQKIRGIALNRDVEKAKAYYAQAWLLGQRSDMQACTTLLEKNDPVRFKILGASAALGESTFGRIWNVFGRNQKWSNCGQRVVCNGRGA